MQIEARQIDIGRVHVRRGRMPAAVMPARPATARVMPVWPPAMPVMTAPIRLVPMPPVPAMTAPLRLVPMLPVPAMSAPARALPVSSMRAVRPYMVTSPVTPVSVMIVPVMCGVDPRTGGRHRGHCDEKRHAGCKESEKLVP